MSTETMNVRRRALASLITICQTIPDHILPVLPVLCTKVQELFAHARVLDSEGVLLYEMLVLVSNSMPHVHERAQFLQQIAQDPIAMWTSADMSTFVSSAQNVVSAIESAASNPATRKMLFKIVNSLTTIYAIAKRASVSNGVEAFAPIWPQLLPNTVMLIRTLHSLQEPAIKDVVLKTSTCCWLMSVSVDEIAQLLGGKHHLEEEQVKTLPIASKWSKWQKNVRDVCYHLMGSACSQPSVYASGHMAAYMQTGMLANMERMNHRHLKAALASVYLPFLKSCPKELYASLLDPVLTRLFTHLSQRFTACFVWANGAGAKASRTTWCAAVVGVEEAKRDVVYDKMLMDLLRQVMEFLESAIDAKTVVGTDTDTPKHVINVDDEYLRDYLLVQSATIPFVLGSIVAQAITWKDTMSCKKAAALADKLVNTLHGDVRFHEMIGRELMTAALQALLDERDGLAKEDGLKWELINLVRNIYCRLTLGLTPVEECKGFDPCNQPLPSPSLMSAVPRAILLSLPELTPEHLESLNVYLRETHSIKSQKNAIKELLEIPMLAIKREEALASSGSSSPIGATTMSLLISGRRSSKQIEDLPEKLVIPSKEQDAAWNTHEAQHANLNSSILFSTQT
jgi:exportin-5